MLDVFYLCLYLILETPPNQKDAPPPTPNHPSQPSNQVMNQPSNQVTNSIQLNPTKSTKQLTGGSSFEDHLASHAR